MTKIINLPIVIEDYEEYQLIKEGIMCQFNSGYVPLGLKNSLKKKFHISNGLNF